MACRGVTNLLLRVGDDTPDRLLASADSPLPDSGGRCSTRVPRLRAHAVRWNLHSSAKLDRPLYALTEAEALEFGYFFNSNLEKVVWPSRLRVLHVGDKFNQPVVKTQWPPSLRQISFGINFNQPVIGVSWPPSLQQLEFNNSFNQPVEGVSWPPSLQRLEFGRSFNQSVANVLWPPSLEELSFGDYFNQTIEGVAWPSSLRTILFGEHFNQKVERVAWPASLQDLVFGYYSPPYTRLFSDFNQAIDKSIWPASLRRVSLGGSFEQSLHGLGRWMPNLEEFTLVNDHVDLLVGIEWPKGLKRFTMREAGRNQDGIVVPPTVEVIYEPECDY